MPKSAKKSPTADELSNWKLLREFRERLAAACKNRAHPVADRDPKRKLTEDAYFSLWFFGMVNPVFDSMRGLCAASHLEKMQQEVCGRPVSLGSFSEAQAVFDPDLLKEVFLELAQQTKGSWGDPRLAHLADQLQLIDGTLLPALPRMHWALWVDENNRAAKLHLKFQVLKQSASEALITAGNVCERKTMRRFVKPGEIYVGDRYYGLEYRFLEELREMRVSFVMRIRNKPYMEVIEELEISEADRAAGVTWQGLVKLGQRWKSAPVRVVKIEVEGKELLLATDLNLEAELIALIYRYRWQIELFFKWLKCILKSRHLLAESPDGVAIQVYTALIAALMLQEFTGKRPSKRQMEMIQLHLMGFIALDELMSVLGLAKTKS